MSEECAIDATAAGPANAEDTAAEPPPALSDWEVEQIAARLDVLLETVLEKAGREVAEGVVELVAGIERLHAEGLRRLAELLATDPELLARARRDPVISNLFELYELSVIEGPVASLDPGGVSPTGDTSVIPEARLVQLGRRLGRGGESASGTAIEGPRVGTIELDEVREAGLLGVWVGDVTVLVVHLEGSVQAYKNACPGTLLPLHAATLDGGVVICPWHGCRFDAVSGAREDGTGEALEPLPTRIEDEQVLVEVG